MNQMRPIGRPPLDIPRMLATALLIILMLAINKPGLLGNIVFFTILGGMIVISPEMAFRAFSISFLGLITNQAIVLKTPVWTVARLVIPALCLARFLLDIAMMRLPLMRPRYLVALAAFVVTAGLLSIATQYYVQIALLKLLNFTIGSFALFLGIKVLKARGSDLTEWMVSLLLAVAILGLATIPLGIGYNFRSVNTRSLFNGPFYHSNTLGPLSAMMTVFLACVFVFGPYRNRWVCGGIAGCMAFFLLLTQSRTGAASLLIGLATLIGGALVLKRRKLIQLPSRVARSTLVLITAASLLVAAAYDIATRQSLTKSLITFAQKGKQTTELSVTDVFASRQGVIELMWDNFLQSPWIGIGFEVSTHPFFKQNATLFNAPIEKGFLPIAVLEETGIIGTTFFVIFLLALYANMVRSLNVPGIALITTFLAVNCGECMFFSLGGHGAFGWLLMAAGIMLGERCVVRQTPPQRRPMPAAPFAPPLKQLQPSYGG